MHVRVGSRVGFLFTLASAALALLSQANAQPLTPATAAQLDAKLAAAMAPPNFTPPGPAIDPAPLKGKLIFTIPVSTTIPFCSVVDQQAATFANRAGLQFQAWQSNAQLAQWAQGFTAAQEHNAALVNVACGLDPATVSPQVAQTLASHVPVVAAHTYAPGQAQLAGLSGIVYGAYLPAARLEVDWIIRQTSGGADVLVITSPNTANSPLIQKTIGEEFAQYCPACKVRYIGVNAADWPTKIGPQVQSAVLADPGLNYVLPIYDGMVQFTVPPIVATGTTDRVKVASFNATPAVLDMILYWERRDLRYRRGHHLARRRDHRPGHARAVGQTADPRLRRGSACLHQGQRRGCGRAGEIRHRLWRVRRQRIRCLVGPALIAASA